MIRVTRKDGQLNARMQTEKPFMDPGTSNGQVGRESHAKTQGVP